MHESRGYAAVQNQTSQHKLITIMSSKDNFTLSDFTSTNPETTTDEIEEKSESPDENDQSENQTDDETRCPYYTEGMRKCRNRLDEDEIESVRIDKIGCGHAANYLSDEYGATIKKGTVESYSSALRNYVEYLHENQTIVIEAEFKQIDQYFKKIARRNVTESTIKGQRAAITQMYKHISMYSEAELNFNWVMVREKIKPHKYNTSQSRERIPLKKDEVKKLYNELNSFRDRLMVQVGVELGPRNTDIISIKMDDIDFDEQEIELSNTKTGGSYTVPVSNQLLLLLRRWVEQERAAHAKAQTTDYLFPSLKGGRIGTSTFRGIVVEAAERAGIQETEQSEAQMHERKKEMLGTDKNHVDYQKVTPHTLRHTFNHLLQEAGIPREFRSKALDHSSEEVTQEFYDHKESNYKELMRELFSTKGSLLD